MKQRRFNIPCECVMFANEIILSKIQIEFEYGLLAKFTLEFIDIVVLEENI